MPQPEELRAWAKGLYALEAATELLIRTGFASAGLPWVHPASKDGGAWIEFEVIPDHVGVLSGGERRLLLLAASIAGEAEVKIGDLLPGLDRSKIRLVLAAVFHAAGAHEHSEWHVSADGRTMVRDPEPAGALYDWPGE